MSTITLWMDGKVPIRVDAEEFETIKLMVKEAGGHKDLNKLKGVIAKLVSQDYSSARATELCVMARAELRKA